MPHQCEDCPWLHLSDRMEIRNKSGIIGTSHSKTSSGGLIHSLQQWSCWSYSVGKNDCQAEIWDDALEIQHSALWHDSFIGFDVSWRSKAQKCPSFVQRLTCQLFGRGLEGIRHPATGRKVNLAALGFVKSIDTCAKLDYQNHHPK